MSEQINLNIIDGDPFFAHEASINFNPTQITFDFKCITPRTDPRSKKPSFQIKHNVIMVDPWHAKNLITVLQDVLKNYEKEFGKIKMPKSIEKAQKKHKAQKKESSSAAPNYMG
ncbi:hypothetical protein DRJ22_03525 [Candidatus Woesearchaeota archaeon]|nr:MAG: hypothetical protein B6U93_01220 [Candidatus Woesearchaeota archaeon ex4484_78]RLE45800.1 MAG: hypothetical protein DRJ22_03525 [Candidatus Woesearchaeota archaeon]